MVSGDSGICEGNLQIERIGLSDCSRFFGRTQPLLINGKQGHADSLRLHDLVLNKSHLTLAREAGSEQEDYNQPLNSMALTTFSMATI